MKAARFYGPGDIRIDDVPEPTTQPGTVKVEVEWAGICGTDLHEYLEGPIFAPTADAPHPLTGESVPITLGHEFAGVVAEVGAGVDRVRVGDRVAVEPYIICGTCDACTQGRYNVCATLGFVGLSGYGGGFAQFVVVEPAQVRKAKAPVAGATHVLDPTTTDVVAEVHELTKGRGADVSFECAGIDAVLASAIRSTRAGGTVVNVAIWGHEASVAMNDLVFREVNVLGSLAYANDHPATIEMVASGKVDPFQFITGRIELDDIVAKGFDELISNKEENVKILVRP